MEEEAEEEEGEEEEDEEEPVVFLILLKRGQQPLWRPDCLSAGAPVPSLAGWTFGLLRFFNFFLFFLNFFFFSVRSISFGPPPSLLPFPPVSLPAIVFHFQCHEFSAVTPLTSHACTHAHWNRQLT